MYKKTDVLIDLFFKDSPFEERVAKIAALGYEAIETWQCGDAAVMKKIGDACKAHKVAFVSAVLNSPGNMEFAPDKTGNQGVFLDRLDKFTDIALAAGCKAGIVTTGNKIPEQSPEVHKKNLVESLRKAGAMAAKKGFNLNLETLNTAVDHKGYYLESREVTIEIINEVNLPNVKMLYDIYHMQIMGGNQLAFILPNLKQIGHFHTAGVPGRHELFDGETNYPFVLRKILDAGYKGFFGLEYVPLLESAASLQKTADYLKS